MKSDSWRKCASCGRFMSYAEMDKAGKLWDLDSEGSPIDPPTYIHKDCWPKNYSW